MSGSRTQLPALTSQVSENFRLTVWAHVNWQTYLTPLSASVAILAELVGLAKSGKDFLLNVDPKSETPKSFQGSLLEICLQAATSFLDIRNHMLKIRINCEDMPDLLKEVGDGSCRDKRLSQRLNFIRNCVEQCKKAARGVEKLLSFLNEKLLELLGGCSASRSFSQVQLQEVQRVLAQTRESIEALEKDEATLEEEWCRVSMECEKIKGALNDVKSQAFTDTLCEEGLRELLDHFPQVLDLLGSVTNPSVLVLKFGQGLKFIISEISALREKDSSSALSSFLANVEEKASQKIREAQSRLDQAGEKYRAQFQSVEMLSKQSARLSSNLAAQEREEQGISLAVLLMTNKLELLAGIRANWSQAVSFIHLLPKLLEDCRQTLERLGDGTGGDTTLLPVVQDHVSQAATIAVLLRDMSASFVDVYDTFLNGALSDLVAVMAQGGSAYKLKAIRESCQKATEKIQQAAQQDVERFEQEVQQGSQALGKLAEHLGPRG